MSLKTFKINEICKIEKGKSPTLKTPPGKYPLVVTAKFRRTANTYQIKEPAICIPLVSSTGHGDAAIHRIHYQEGKFALANIMVALIPKKPEICYPKYLFHLLMAKKDQCLVPLMKGTANVSLKERDIANLQLSFPPVNEQRKIVLKFEDIMIKIDNAATSLKKIKFDLEQYQNSILKFAFEGKLTKTWRISNKQNNGDATKLFEKIKAEKEINSKELIEIDLASKKMIDLPENWKWVALGNVVNIINGKTPKGLENSVSQDTIPFYKVQDMNTPENKKFMSTAAINLDEGQVKKFKLKVQPKGIVIFPKRGGAIATNKKRILSKPSCYDLNTMGLYPIILYSEYLYFWLCTVDLITLSDGTTIPQINNTDITPLLFPLAPLEEQTEIIKCLNYQLSRISEIEKIFDKNIMLAEKLSSLITNSLF